MRSLSRACTCPDINLAINSLDSPELYYHTMTENVDAELPPFSFRKHPIKNMYSQLAILTILHTAVLAKLLDQKPESKGDKPSLNNINYDEQIRAPRMSAANHYTYTSASPVPFTDGTHTTMLSRELLKMDTETEMDPPQEETPASSADQYLPATADITQPTRRSLEPHVYYGSRDSPSDDASAGSLEPDRLTLLRAIDNLASNTMSAERPLERSLDGADDDSGHVTTPTNNNTTDIDRTHGTSPENESTLQNGLPLGGRARAPRGGPGVQQVYHLKKPLCTPAVLRPISDEPDTETPLETLPFEIPDAGDDAAPQEPTHSHWQPNSSTDHCMKCFEVFGNFFSPVKRRRHHCRFCGQLFCQSCFYQSPEMHYLEVPSTPEHVSDQSDDESPAKMKSGRKSSGLSEQSDKSRSDRVSNLSRVSDRSKHGLGRTYSLSSSSSTDDLAGVMMDSRARLVVPLFRNGPGDLRSRFKLCKLCKSCGYNYQRLVTAMNQLCDVESPYVFVENPYVLGQRKPVDRRSSVPERRHLLVTSGDWMWSSF